MQRNDIRRKSCSDPILESIANASCVLDCVIDMQGTKKVEIPGAIMHAIMKVILDDSNYPVLIHCNHGKVCVLDCDTSQQN